MTTKLKNVPAGIKNIVKNTTLNDLRDLLQNYEPEEIEVIKYHEELLDKLKEKTRRIQSVQRSVRLRVIIATSITSFMTFLGLVGGLRFGWVTNLIASYPPIGNALLASLVGLAICNIASVLFVGKLSEIFNKGNYANDRFMTAFTKHYDFATRRTPDTILLSATQISEELKKHGHIIDARDVGIAISPFAIKYAKRYLLKRK